MPPSRNGSDIDVKTFRSPGGRDVVKWNGITFSEMGASSPLVERERERERTRTSRRKGERETDDARTKKIEA